MASHLEQMGWSTAPAIVRVSAIVAFLAATVALGLATYQPNDPQLVAQAVISAGCGAIIAWLVLLAGNAVTHPRTREEARFVFSRQPFTGRNRVVLLQFVITVAVGGMAIVNLLAWARHGAGWVAAASCVTLCAVMFYPYVRHRIERGRWPD